MKRFFCLTLSVVFIFGVLFPVSRTSEGKYPFVEHIKKIFGYSTGVTGKEGAKRAKGPILHGEGKSAIFQEIRNAFHFFPEDVERPKAKKSPLKFDKTLQKELRYPPEKEGIK